MLHHHISLQYLNNDSLQKIQMQSRTVGIPDFSRALTQYDDLCKTLSDLGATVSVLPCHTSWLSRFAVMAGRLAIIGRTTDKEIESRYSTIASVLAGDSILKFIEEPGIVDGRDVVRVGETFLIGLSDTTNYEGASQLALYLTEAGWQAQLVDSLPASDIHLQDHILDIGENRVIVSDLIEKHYALIAYDKVVIEYRENIIPNAIALNGTVIIASGFIDQEQRLVQNNVRIVPVNLSEFAKLGIALNNLTLQTVGKPETSEKLKKEISETHLKKQA